MVLQGGLGVARHLHEAVQSGTTSVIVFGSGGVCDALVKLIRHIDATVRGYCNVLYKVDYLYLH